LGYLVRAKTAVHMPRGHKLLDIFTVNVGSL
jgi:hypothetical protein